MDELNEFQELGLSDISLNAVKAKGFETPSPIQKITIPHLLKSSGDIIAQAQTGTGKTAAFGLPILDSLEPNGKIQALILTPTRELALQVCDEIISYKGGRPVTLTSIYGGASMLDQLRRLKKGVDIVVGTPGRVLDHIARGSLDLSFIKWFVLDEADEMLNMGFIDDIESILQQTPADRRVLLFSATMPDRIAKLAKKYLKNSTHLKVEANQLTTELTDQIYFEVNEGDRFDALTRIVDVEPEFYGLVFCRTKVSVDEVVSKLLARGYDADGLHGDLTQLAREKILARFKNKHITILVATDVAARGIDIHDLTHVINYSLPQDFEAYIHRIGRTGRAGKEGTAITFISPKEYRQLMAMQKVIKTQLRKEKLPNAQDIVDVKKNRIKDDIAQIIEIDSHKEYLELATEILNEYAPEVALSALIRSAFKNELDVRNYPEIRTFKVDRRGTARLFIALGRVDDFTPRALVEFLEEHTELRGSKIDDVKVCENFSFATVPFEDAEKVLKSLNALRSKGDKPLAEISKENREQRDSSGGGGRPHYDKQKQTRYRDRDRDRGGRRR